MVLYSPFSNRTDGSGYNYLLREEKEGASDGQTFYTRTHVCCFAAK